MSMKTNASDNESTSLWIEGEGFTKLNFYVLKTRCLAGTLQSSKVKNHAAPGTAQSLPEAFCKEEQALSLEAGSSKLQVWNLYLTEAKRKRNQELRKN